MPNILNLDGMDVVAFEAAKVDSGLQSNWKILSNNAITPIEMKTEFGDKTFPSVNHYLQYMRQPNNSSLLEQLVAKDESGKFKVTAEEASKIGIEHFKTLSAEDQKKFVDNANQYHEAAVKAKFDQHAEVMSFALKSTGNAVIVRDSSNLKSTDGKDETSMGYNNQDLSKPGNLQGKALMNLRNSMYKAEIAQHEAGLVVLNQKLGPLKAANVAANMAALASDAEFKASPESTAVEAEISALKAKLAAVKALVVENVDEYSEKLRELWKTKYAAATLANNATLPHKDVPAPDAATQKKFDALAALQPAVPVAKPTSKLTAKPKDVSNGRLGAFNDPKHIAAMVKELQTKWPDSDWKQTATDPDSTTLGNKHDQSFTVTKDSISTSKDDVETFKSMLVGFKAAFPNETPKVTIEDPKLKDAWDKAIAETNIKTEIVVASAKAPKSADQTPDEPRSSPGMRR